MSYLHVKSTTDSIFSHLFNKRDDIDAPVSFCLRPPLHVAVPATSAQVLSSFAAQSVVCLLRAPVNISP